MTSIAVVPCRLVVEVQQGKFLPCDWPLSTSAAQQRVDRHVSRCQIQYEFPKHTKMNPNFMISFIFYSIFAVTFCDPMFRKRSFLSIPNLIMSGSEKSKQEFSEEEKAIQRPNSPAEQWRKRKFMLSYLLVYNIQN